MLILQAIPLETIHEEAHNCHNIFPSQVTQFRFLLGDEEHGGPFSALANFQYVQQPQSQGWLRSYHYLVGASVRNLPEPKSLQFDVLNISHVEAAQNVSVFNLFVNSHIWNSEKHAVFPVSTGAPHLRS